MFKRKNTIKDYDEVNKFYLNQLNDKCKDVDMNTSRLLAYIERLERIIDTLDTDIRCHTISMSDFKKNNNLKVDLEDKEMSKKINVCIESIISMMNDMSKENRLNDIDIAAKYLEICRQAVAGLYTANKK